MTVQTQIPDFAAARTAMIDSQLRPQGVTDPMVLEAMGAVLRERYLPDGTRPLAYVDRGVGIGDGRFLSPPAVLGKLLNQMRPRTSERALVVGAGSGYSSAILTHIGLDVVALESSATLAARARELGVEAVEGPLETGWAKGASYDLILIDGAVEHIPDAIIGQLADGGQLGTALIERGVARLIIGRKVAGAFGYLTLGDAGTPALPGFSRPATFKF